MRRAAIVLSVLLGASGCGSSHQAASLDQLKQRIEEMAQAQAEGKKRIEELSNRIFLLEDRVDTSRVAMESSGSPPRLPVVRLRPSGNPASDESDGEGEPGDEGQQAKEAVEEEEGEPQGRSVVEEKQVSYAGEARRQGPRPLLRLYGSSSASSASQEPVAAPLPGPDPAAVSEKLPVVPLPARSVARSIAAAPSSGTAAARSVTGGAGGGSQRQASVEPMRDYESALTMYRSGKHTAAAQAFQTFLARYTRHAYADNALYWLGECFYDTKNYQLALKVFRRVVEQYPTGNKAPDALLKMAYSYLKLREPENARTVLAQVVESFPKSQVARLASEALVKIQ